MPIDYEMIAASPPVFSHSPPSNFLSTNYNYLRYGPATFSPTNNRLSSQVFAKNPSRHLSTIMQPRRPCLVIRTDENDTDSTTATSPTESPQNPLNTERKKKVSFADDKGLSLTQVRVMNEPSSCPPCWTKEFLSQITKGVNAEVVAEPWEVTFSQPASDYIEFRKKLDVENVSLENVIVKENEKLILGTVKVRNLSYHKEVFIRVTFDHWKTHEDAFCTFVPNNPVSFGCGAATTGYVLYDTFSFRIHLQPNSNKVEFCVCYRTDGVEYWDSNNGKNYIIVKSITPPKPPITNDDNNNNERNNKNNKVNDALRAKIDTWSEFASWNHLVNDAPYW